MNAKALSQREIDNLADIVWWIKGFHAGAKENYNCCPFDETHVEALRKARLMAVERFKELTQETYRNETEAKAQRDGSLSGPL